MAAADERSALSSGAQQPLDRARRRWMPAAAWRLTAAVVHTMKGQCLHLVRRATRT